MRPDGRISAAEKKSAAQAESDERTPAERGKEEGIAANLVLFYKRLGSSFGDIVHIQKPQFV